MNCPVFNLIVLFCLFTFSLCLSLPKTTLPMLNDSEQLIKSNMNSLAESSYLFMKANHLLNRSTFVDKPLLGRKKAIKVKKKVLKKKETGQIENTVNIKLAESVVIVDNNFTNKSKLYRNETNTNFTSKKSLKESIVSKSDAFKSKGESTRLQDRFQRVIKSQDQSNKTSLKRSNSSRSKNKKGKHIFICINTTRSNCGKRVANYSRNRSRSVKRIIYGSNFSIRIKKNLSKSKIRPNLTNTHLYDKDISVLMKKLNVLNSHQQITTRAQRKNKTSNIERSKQLFVNSSELSPIIRKLLNINNSSNKTLEIAISKHPNTSLIYNATTSFTQNPLFLLINSHKISKSDQERNITDLAGNNHSLLIINQSINNSRPSIVQSSEEVSRNTESDINEWVIKMSTSFILLGLFFMIFFGVIIIAYIKDIN